MTTLDDKARSSLFDVELPVQIVVGETMISLKDVSEWKPDTVIALTARASKPLELCVNGRVIATGELCEGDDGPDSLAIRILDIRQRTEEA